MRGFNSRLHKIVVDVILFPQKNIKYYVQQIFHQQRIVAEVFSIYSKVFSYSISFRKFNYKGGREGLPDRAPIAWKLYKRVIMEGFNSHLHEIVFDVNLVPQNHIKYYVKT